VKVCPTEALSIVGRNVTVGEILGEIERDRKFYEPSGGGVTFSGGEPAMQPEFLLALVKAAKAEGINVAVETSGLAPFSVYESILPYVNTFLFDYKETNEARHREFTGVSNELILANLRKLHDSGASILVRCPVIPGLNDRDEHFEGIARLTRELPNLIGAEILGYHKLAASKSGRMGLSVQDEYEPPSPELKAEWNAKLESYGARIYEA
jgi:pyruvate formate lyase activating enzyme